MEGVKHFHAPTHEVAIYIAGDAERIAQECQAYCTRVGLCVSVTSCTFAYRYGRETGARVGLLNYPRFPKPADEIEARARELAEFLLERLDEGSCSVVTPSWTTWYTRRGDDEVVPK